MDYEQIRQIVRAEDAADDEAAAIDQRFGGQDLRTDVRRLVVSAIAQNLDPEHYNDDQHFPDAHYLQDVFFSAFTNIVFGQLRKTLFDTNPANTAAFDEHMKALIREVLNGGHTAQATNPAYPVAGVEQPHAGEIGMNNVTEEGQE